MKRNTQLKFLKIYGYPVRWFFKQGQFIAMYRGRGMKVTLRPEAKRHDIMQMAGTVKRELVAADKGELDAEAEELWSRQTGERVDTRAPSKDTD